MNNQDPQTLLPLTPLTFHVLLALADTNRHGYGIIKEVSSRTDGQMELEAGTLYAALKRMRDEGLIEIIPSAERPASEDSRRRTYRLTTFGRGVLQAESTRLAHLIGVVVQKEVIPLSSALGDAQ